MLGTCGMDMDCGGCIGCCSSSYFIHITPRDEAALTRIPKGVLFPAPGMPQGHMLMGYDKKGFCPMMKKGTCAIYDDRPQTCRTYDCRVFTAAGLAAGGRDKAVINERVARWKFSYPADEDRQAHRAVRAAAAFIRDHAEHFPGGRAPDNPSQLAVLAVKVYDVFFETEKRRKDADVAKAVVSTARLFDANRLDRADPLVRFSP